ncbi:hypothetical protein NYP20_10285 [Pseudomonas sp. N3-W]|jgi:hypothetical protein|uniref:Uncharacterized protein n=1 Tax=Pseudomonas fungipugnans TaxID=3024217 RepID=A0ABT6QVN4_9PSED|nr:MULTISPECIES: hypothetical protein [unclassified Pseudomonas]MDI2594968.1 hypothetical protein [Pseudomonas sp. 681]UWF51318.1 hypothetical protein NYP20_10285 [Pseudomonas sp. N3-W]
MRLNRLLAIFAPVALLLPLTAHADWPAGLRKQYMDQCVPAAAQKIGDAAAKAVCGCGADQLKSYPASDLKALMSGTASQELGDKAMQKIALCRTENGVKK